MTEPRKVALITGITGQDGSYLAELLLGKGYVVSILQRVRTGAIVVICFGHLTVLAVRSMALFAVPRLSTQGALITFTGTVMKLA